MGSDIAPLIEHTPELRFGPPKKPKTAMKTTTPEETDKEKDELESSEEEFAVAAVPRRRSKKIVIAEEESASDKPKAPKERSTKNTKGKGRARGVKGLTPRPASPKGPAARRLLRARGMKRGAPSEKAKEDSITGEASESVDERETKKPRTGGKAKSTAGVQTRAQAERAGDSNRRIKGLPKRGKTAKSSKAFRDLGDEVFDEGDEVNVDLVPLVEDRVGCSYCCWLARWLTCGS